MQYTPWRTFSTSLDVQSLGRVLVPVPVHDIEQKSGIYPKAWPYIVSQGWWWRANQPTTKPTFLARALLCVKVSHHPFKEMSFQSPPSGRKVLRTWLVGGWRKVCRNRFQVLSRIRNTNYVSSLFTVASGSGKSIRYKQTTDVFCQCCRMMMMVCRRSKSCFCNAVN